MCEKEYYYYYGNSEFMSGLGVIYTEFTGQRESRQINVLNGHSYASSCLQDYNGNLYIGTDNGLYRLSLDNSILHFEHDSRDASSIPNNIDRKSVV